MKSSDHTTDDRSAERSDAHLSPAGQTMARALRNAAAGLPRDAEQDARWRKLGIHPDQTSAA